jgi:hypothetical protein
MTTMATVPGRPIQRVQGSRAGRSRPMMNWHELTVQLVPPGTLLDGDIDGYATEIDRHGRVGAGCIRMTVRTRDMCGGDDSFESVLDYVRDEVLAQARATLSTESSRRLFEVRQHGRGVSVDLKARAKAPDEPDDPMKLLENDLNRLILQAASLNTAATKLQTEAFYLTYTELQQRYRALEERMSKLDASLSLAFTAVADCTA